MSNGMSLLVAYLFLLVLCIPPVFIQLKLGNHQQKGIVSLLSTHVPILKGIGITLLIQLFLMCVFMAPLVTHYGMYAFIAIAKNPYVWTSCANVWNTASCFQNPTDLLGTMLTSGQKHNVPPSLIPAESEFFDNEYLQISGNISDVRGFAVWGFSDEVNKAGVSVLPLAMVGVWVFIFLGLAFGARIVSMFTILDNLVDGLVAWSETFQERRACINFCAAFALISVGIGASILHTTQAGLYYIIVMDQCVPKLFFLTVALYGLTLIIIYAKQNFGIAERVVMSFITELEDIPRYHEMEIKGLWDLRIKFVFCGIKQDPYSPPEEYGYRHPDPSAPPYGGIDHPTYTYMDQDGYPMEDLSCYKYILMNMQVVKTLMHA
ncbi:INE-like protein [Mya arenaria]|uniref:INE-like protein n=1 Tax=Mya arenaria TaxID=6604 RepID=A0ABY7EKX0_MYAAR|nr:INE-like protein [Mya arenaria]